VLFSVGLVAYLGHQLSAIGWRQVIACVPATPWFYLAFAGLYFCVPLFEGLAWRLLWGVPVWRTFPVLVRKRLFSRQLLDYSGEAYLYLWSCRNIELPPRQLLHMAKDNVIVSSLASGLVAAVALAGLLLTRQLVLPLEMLERDAVYLAAAAVGAVVAGLLVVRFRHRLIWLPRPLVRRLAAIHVARLAAMLLLQLWMWTTVDPQVPLRSWLSLLAVEIVVSRIPFLPNRDLVLFGTGLEVAGAIQVARPLLAGMLLTVGVLERALNLAFYLLFSVGPWAGDVARPAAVTGPAAAPRPGEAQSAVAAQAGST